MLPKKSLTEFLLLMALVVACSNQSSIANRYLTAERLWTEKNYEGSVAEFDQIIKEDPNSAIALQALLRSSMTKVLFLNQPEIALQGFKLYLEKAKSSDHVPQIQKEIGEIYFTKLKQYTAAIEHYQSLLESGIAHNAKFSDRDRHLFLYRIARSHFLLSNVKRAIEAYQTTDGFTLKHEYDSELKVRTLLDLGQAWYAIGENEKLGFQNATQAFLQAQKEIKNISSPLYYEAEFGIASVMEEMDQLEQAYAKFKQLEKVYPAPNVIKIKTLRLEERLKKKKKMKQDKNSLAAWGMLSVIVTEMVVSPGILGGGAYYVCEKLKVSQPVQLIATVLGAVLGLAIAINRIMAMSKKDEKGVEEKGTDG